LDHIFLFHPGRRCTKKREENHQCSKQPARVRLEQRPPLVLVPSLSPPISSPCAASPSLSPLPPPPSFSPPFSAPAPSSFPAPGYSARDIEPWINPFAPSRPLISLGSTGFSQYPDLPSFSFDPPSPPPPSSSLSFSFEPLSPPPPLFGLEESSGFAFPPSSFPASASAPAPFPQQDFASFQNQILPSFNSPNSPDSSPPPGSPSSELSPQEGSEPPQPDACEFSWVVQDSEWDEMQRHGDLMFLCWTLVHGESSIYNYMHSLGAGHIHFYGKAFRNLAIMAQEVLSSCFFAPEHL